MCAKASSGDEGLQSAGSAAVDAGRAVLRLGLGSWFLSREEWAEITRSLRFSPREAEIASLIVANVGNAGIAAQLGISAHTVHSYLERMYRKLRIGSREELISVIFLEYVSHRCRHTR